MLMKSSCNDLLATSSLQTFIFYAPVGAILREAIFVMDGHSPRRGGTKADGIACELAR